MVMEVKAIYCMLDGWWTQVAQIDMRLSSVALSCIYMDLALGHKIMMEDGLAYCSLTCQQAPKRKCYGTDAQHLTMLASIHACPHMPEPATWQ